MPRRPRRAHAGQALVEYLLLITVVGVGCLAGIGYLRDSTATAYTRQQQALIAPTFAPSTYVAPTATPTPVTEVRTAVQHDSANTKTEESQYQVRLYNDGYAPASGLKARVFFNLTARDEMKYTGANVAADELADSCGAAQFGPITAWNDANKVYYMDIDWPGRSFASGSYCEVELSLHLKDWDKAWDWKDDYSYDGLNYGNYKSTGFIPVYRDGVKVYGTEPAR